MFENFHAVEIVDSNIFLSCVISVRIFGRCAVTTRKRRNRHSDIGKNE